MTRKLAAHGGEKVRKRPLVPEEHLRARFGEEEKRALAEVVDSGRLCRVFGNTTKKFERELAEYFGVAGAAASTSGTAAIHCALAACGVGPGDEVVTSPITDMGSVIPIILLGAVPVFADVDPKTFNVTAESIGKALTERTKAVVPVHLAGQSCVMGPILDLAREHGFRVIEDCAQSFLSTCDGRTAGTMGDAGCFSLNDFKHITCGDGGFVISDDPDLIRRAGLFADKGYTRTGPVRNCATFGVNYRISELQAAVARVQLGKLRSIIERRLEFAKGLDTLLGRIEAVHTPAVAKGVEHSFWFYPFTIDAERLDTDPAIFAAEVAAEGIPVAFPYLPTPVYLFKAIREITVCDRKIKYPKGLCPVAEKTLAGMMVLPVNEFMTKADARDIAKAVEKVCDYHLG